MHRRARGRTGCSSATSARHRLPLPRRARGLASAGRAHAARHRLLARPGREGLRPAPHAARPAPSSGAGSSGARTSMSAATPSAWRAMSTGAAPRSSPRRAAWARPRPRPRSPTLARGRPLSARTSTDGALAVRATHLPLLRRRLRRPGHARRRRQRRRIAGDPGASRPISAGCARRARRWARRWASRAGCSIPRSPADAGELGRGARMPWPTRFRATIARARAGRGRVLRLRPAADRGLLRRQQADEGLHRHRATSTPIRGCAWRRRWPATSAPSAPTRCPAATRTSTRPTCVRAGRLQRRLVPSGAVPAHEAAKERAAGAARRRHRPARAPPPAKRPTCTRRQARHGCAAVQRPAGRSGRPRRCVDETFVASHTRAVSDARWPRRGRRTRSADGGRRRPASPPPTSRSFYDWFAAHARARSPSSRRASTSRRTAPTRSTRSSTCHLLDRPDRQAGHGAVLDHRPAQRHGRARGRRARQPARRAHGFRRRGAVGTRPRASGGAERLPARPGLKAVELFQAVADGRDQGALGDRHQPGGQPAATPTRCARRWPPARSLVVSDCMRAHRHDAMRRACAAAGRRLGREGRHGHQFRAPHLAPARLPAAARRGAARLVDGG